MNEGSESEGFDLLQVVTELWSHRMSLIKGVFGVAVVSAIISLLLPKYYKSTASLLPETDKAKLAGLAGLSSLASLAGVNLGEASLEQLYPTIVGSEAVLRDAIFAKYKTEAFPDSVNLVQYLEIEEDTEIEVFEVALEEVRDNLDVNFNKITQVVTITVWSEEPELSAAIVNRITARLDEFIRTKRNTNASEQRAWIERRLDEVSNDLRRSENQLKEFREKNRRLLDSPELLLVQQRLLRDVEMNAVVFTELKKQFELARIEEVKNVPIITILDSGRAAAKKDRPKRAIIVIVCSMLAGIVGAGLVLVKARYPQEWSSMLVTMTPMLRKK